MSVNSVAKLKGNISEIEIIKFLKKRFDCEIINDVETSVHDSDYYKHFEDSIKEFYDADKKYIQRNGFIHLKFQSNIHHTLFYSYNSVNFYDNLEYFSEKGLEDMVKSETTFLSTDCSEQGIEIIKTITKHFGGWYCKNDCDDDYQSVVSTKDCGDVTRIDIMTDIETLGKGNNPPVFQIAACAFDISTGRILESINITADVSKMDNIEGDTLIWWLKTNKELLLDLLLKGKEGGKTERDIVWEFCDWVNLLKKKYLIEDKKVFLWGNGILFDNRIIKRKCDMYDAEYPIHYRCDRDMRTILELAATKMGYENDQDYRHTIENVGTEHDAFDDVKHQILVVTKAYNDIMNTQKENIDD